MKEIPDDPPRWVNGTPAGVRYGTTERTAERFTFLVGDVAGLFRKLEFEREQFSEAHHRNPPDVDGIVFSCLNFLLTAQSMYDWLSKELRVRDGNAFDESAFDAIIADRVPFHGLCRDVANTLKHRGFRDGGWPNGSVILDYLPGDGVAALPVAVLIFTQPGGMHITASSLIDIVVMNWRFLLIDYGLIPNPE